LDTAVYPVIMYPSLESDQNICPSCHSHVSLKYAAGGDHAGQYYLNCFSRHADNKPYWFFFQPGAAPSTQ
ncbi:hypothetical protein FPV67DRAFT_1397474, partial [Lyophyllum atratum]